jgi:hypothetical protein
LTQICFVDFLRGALERVIGGSNEHEAKQKLAKRTCSFSALGDEIRRL